MSPGRSAALVAALALGWGGPAAPDGGPRDALPDRVSALLDEAEAIEVLSIDPKDRPAGPGESFHGWKVLGRTRLADREAGRRVVASIRRGVAEADGASGCFEPRHGLRASKGGEAADLVICFSCRWIEARVGASTTSVRTSDAARAALNRALRGAGVTLAPDG